MAESFKKQAEGYGAEEKELFAKGEALEHQTEEKLKDSEHHEHRHHILTIGSAYPEVSGVQCRVPVKPNRRGEHRAYYDLKTNIIRPWGGCVGI